MTLPDEMLNIETPENVAFGYNVAGIGSRFLAALVDSALIVLLQVIVIISSALILNTGHMADSLGAWVSAIYGLIAFVLFWGYYIFFEILWNGQSPGKRMVGLRVIRSDGTPVTLAETLIRNLVRLIDFLPFGYGVGVVTMFVNDQARRLGDLAAGSLVIHDGGDVSIRSIALQQSALIPPGVVAPDPGLPLERIQPQDIQIIEDFLSRRMQLANAQVLAVQILKRQYASMGLEPPQDLSQADRQLASILVGIRNRYSAENDSPQKGEAQ